MPKYFPSMLVLIALVTIIFGIAVALVDEAAAAPNGRTQHALAERQAAVDYRKARVQCNEAPDVLLACIATAHEEETRFRAAAAARHLPRARQQRRALPELAGND